MVSVYQVFNHYNPQLFQHDPCIFSGSFEIMMPPTGCGTEGDGRKQKISRRRRLIFSGQNLLKDGEL